MTEIKVGVHQFAPLVERTGGDHWAGFEIELLRSVAQRSNLELSFFEVPDFKNLLDETARGTYDLAVGGITRTHDRLQSLRASYFTVDTGLGLAVRKTGDLRFRVLLNALWSRNTGMLFAVLMSMSFVLAHGYWLFERGASVPETYVSGLGHSFWWVLVTASTVGYGDISPVTTGGLWFGGVCILLGLTIFSLFVAHVTSALTTSLMQPIATTIEELKYKTIAVKENTTSHDYLKNFPVNLVFGDTVEECADYLEEGKVDAVLADSTPLALYTASRPHTVLVGGEVARQVYTFMFPLDVDEDLLLSVNQSLTYLVNDGTYDELYERYLN